MKGKVYDLPTRVFHWLFAGLFLTAFTISNSVDDESKLFSFHMLAGLTLSFVVFMRVIWGVIGTKHAKFSGFSLNPIDLFSYAKGILTGDLRRWAGHNPASSWAAIIMMTLAVGLGLTGYLMSSGAGTDTLEEIHELLSNAFIIVVLLHVCGIVLHTIRHKEMIALSMIDGNKVNIDSQDLIPTQRSFSALLFIAVVAIFGISLLQNYNAQNQTLSFFGSTLQLGENEEAEHDDDD